MKWSITIGVILIVMGSLYCWWWNQPIKQMADLAVQTGQRPQNWTELDQQYPHLSKTFRLLEIDPFDHSVENPSQEAISISDRVYLTSGRRAGGGIIIILIGIALPLVKAIRERKRS